MFWRILFWATDDWTTS